MGRQCNSNVPVREEEVHLLNPPLHWNELGEVQAAWSEGSQWVPEHPLVALASQWICILIGNHVKIMLSGAKGISL